MRQYLDAKQQHRDAILLFRMGDFYEMFYEDALVAARALELTLTSRSKDANGGGIPMCGVPFHAVDGYIARLVKKGFRVAICDQVEDPRKAKGLVKREVVRVVSPGTLTDANYLDAREPAFLMAIAPAPTRRRLDAIGVALLDLSTGEFTAAEYAGADGLQALADELAVLKPREIVVPCRRRRRRGVARADRGRRGSADHADRRLDVRARSRRAARCSISCAPAASKASASTAIRPPSPPPARSCTTCASTQKVDLAHVRAIAYRQRADALLIDPTTLEASRDPRRLGRRPRADRCSTSSIARSPRSAAGCCASWLLRPLVALEPIRDRLDAVEELAFRTTERGKFRDAIKARAGSRAAGRARGARHRRARAIWSASSSRWRSIPRVRTVLAELQAPLVRIARRRARRSRRRARRDRVARSIDEPPALARDGGFTRDGVDRELDELRRISRSGKQVIAEMEERERARTGIASLKVRYNRVFGYYIEISKSNLHAVPPDYHRKQTIAGGERFITPALKEYEEKVLGADERILERELEIFETLRRGVAAEAPRIQATARALATLDVLAALAEAAAVNNYIKPHVHDGDELAVVDARHPVVERRTRGRRARSCRTTSP